MSSARFEACPRLWRVLRVLPMLLGANACASGSVDVTHGEAGSSGSPASMVPSGPASAPVSSPSELAAIFDGECATASARAELLAANLLFVIDRSSSMACNPPPTTDSAACEVNSARKDALLPSKWEVVRAELRRAIAALPDNTLAGLTYFSNNNGCGVNATPSVEIGALSAAQRAAIEGSLGNVEPGGATPLVGATVLAYRYLHEAALAGKLSGNKFVVVLSDGEQSDECSDPARCTDAEQCTDQLISAEVPKAAGPGVGIKTFVIGAPGSEPARRLLSQIALLGGTGLSGCSVDQGTCHFDMTRRPEFGPALAEALAAIAGRTLSCELPLPSGLAGAGDPALVNVVFTPRAGAAPELVLKDDRAACDAGADGWQYANAGTRIRLCGKACQRVRAERAARVDLVFGCRVRVPQ